MATEVHEGANGNLKVKEQEEPLGELKPITTNKEEKPVDMSASAGDVNGCETLAGKEEPLGKIWPPNKYKGVVQDGLDVEDGNEPHPDANDYLSDDEEGDGDGEEDAREVDGERDEEDEDDEYVEDDGEEEEGDDEESQPPPNKRRK